MLSVHSPILYISYIYPIYIYIYIYISHLPYLLGYGWALRLLPYIIVNKAAMNIGIHISFPITVSFFPLCKYPEVKLLDHMAVLFLIF